MDEKLLLAAFILGAIHVFSPEHWIPLSLSAWQKGWSKGRFLLGGLGIVFFHLVTALLLAVLFKRLFLEKAFEYSVFFCLAMALVRVFRVSFISRLFEPGLQGKRGFFGTLGLVFRFIGPAETLIPIWIKAPNLFILSAYALLTVITFLLLNFRAYREWEDPIYLSTRLKFFPSPQFLLPASLLWSVVVSLVIVLYY